MNNDAPKDSSSGMSVHIGKPMTPAEFQAFCASAKIKPTIIKSSTTEKKN
jgi:hypothetical protein